ncbi:hypothetical protein [Rickettsia endosymbiont of Oedothorax gibbosus]|uniref:hypothetical protein n=1 Tax=Rickettsia endosymbiont of Oedothorax gibbosus TaxID=931099 RepID=UPI002025B13C|nr:hypothetical protein [Rickettsia endosymbiont of Oedothorax gibbosus]
MAAKELVLNTGPNDKSELMVLVSSIEIEQDIFALYKFCWSVERLFLHLKAVVLILKKVTL